ncbi:multi-sensor signal transduction histidine kinase [Candidatus Magnetomorum sp. HK-1]|nr:multi-sensor signal transduction histidine kinase [Candidatus Magnetomorum sp. HK-1]
MLKVKTPRDAKGPETLKIVKRTSSSVYSSRMPARSSRHVHHAHSLTGARQIVRIDRQPWEQRVAEIHNILEDHRYARANALFNALNEANKAMDEAIKKKTEVEAFSEELQAANEEMRAANEEARAQAEEMRAANEELRAVSEELERMHSDVEIFSPILQESIQNPVTQMSQFASTFLTKHQDKLSEQEKKELQTIADQGSKMSNVLTSMTNYWRIELEGKTLETADSELILENAMNKFQDLLDKKGGKITNNDLPMVVVDEKQFTRLFEVLIDNAIKYSGEISPQIHVNGVNIKETNIDIPEPVMEQGWLFSIQDNGIGIEKNDIDRIFNIFSSLPQKSDSIGMGLAIAWRIVKRHGGNIWIDSTPGKGTCVYFTIPEYE